MLLKSEAELIEIEERALNVLDYLDKQREQFERDFSDQWPPPALEQAAQSREDFHYLLDMVRRITVFSEHPMFSISVGNWRVGGLPVVPNLSETRPPALLS
jgi:hypothetical protein